MGCKCPGGGKGCQFRYRRCANKKRCRKRCKSGVPHCPWFTKNRNPHNGTRIHNTGPKRPGNKEGGHHWGGKYVGHGHGPGQWRDVCIELYDGYASDFGNGCLFLFDPAYKATNISYECCRTIKEISDACYCDCCYNDAAGDCIHAPPACRPGRCNPTWHPPDPVCPWQGPQ